MNQEIDVRIVKEGRIGFFTALMMLGLVIWMWKFLLLFAVLFVAVVIVVFCVLRYRARQHELMAILQRCEMQHYWAMRGDPRGTYGRDCTNPHVNYDWCWFQLPKSEGGRWIQIVNGENLYEDNGQLNFNAKYGPAPNPPGERLRRVGGETVERHQ